MPSVKFNGIIFSPPPLKPIYSESATKFEKNLPDKFDVYFVWIFFSNFVPLSENLDFTRYVGKY